MFFCRRHQRAAHDCLTAAAEIFSLTSLHTRCNSRCTFRYVLHLRRSQRSPARTYVSGLTGGTVNRQVLTSRREVATQGSKDAPLSPLRHKDLALQSRRSADNSIIANFNSPSNCTTIAAAAINCQQTTSQLRQTIK